MTDVTLLYRGRHGAVDVPMPDGTERHVDWETPLVTTADHARLLLEQPDNWKAAPKTAKQKPDTTGKEE